MRKTLEQETKEQLKNVYTKDEVYSIFQDFLKECIENKSNTLNTFTALKFFDKFKINK